MSIENISSFSNFYINAGEKSSQFFEQKPIVAEDYLSFLAVTVLPRKNVLDVPNLWERDSWKDLILSTAKFHR